MGRDGVWADEETSGVLAGSVPNGRMLAGSVPGDASWRYCVRKSRI